MFHQDLKGENQMSLIVKGIEETGGLPGQASGGMGFAFKHLVLERAQALIQQLLPSIAQSYDADFISIEEEGVIEFIHVSRLEVAESIKSNGLILSDEDFVLDLGKGIYVIEDADDEAEQHLLDYLESSDDEEILVVRGCYSGKYTRCLYGEGHVGYIVIKENIPAKCIEQLDILPLEDILFYGFG